MVIVANLKLKNCLQWARHPATRAGLKVALGRRVARADTGNGSGLQNFQVTWLISTAVPRHASFEMLVPLMQKWWLETTWSTCLASCIHHDAQLLGRHDPALEAGLCEWVHLANSLSVFLRAVERCTVGDPLGGLGRHMDLLSRKVDEKIERLVKAVEAEQLAGPEVLKMVGECADAIHPECVEKSPCAGCGCLVDSSDSEKLEFGCTALKTLVAGATAKRSIEAKLELARSCCWGGVGGRRMFGTGGGINPLTITRHGADWLYLDPARWWWSSSIVLEVSEIMQRVRRGQIHLQVAQQDGRRWV